MQICDTLWPSEHPTLENRMVVTTWDGHLRIDRLAGVGAVALTLVTMEPATEAQLRTGLVAGFVTADPQGPPTFVAVALQDGRIPDDVAALLGPRVSAAVTDLLAAGRSGQWLQLDLVEIDNLAVAWAPYRAVTLVADQAVPTNRGALGSWADELWTCLGLPSWRDAFRALGGPPAAQFRGTERPGRGDEPDSPAVRGTWRLPDELAAAVGVEPEVAWALRSATQDAVEIDLRVRPTGQPRGAVLQAGLDDGSQRWVPFRADPAGELSARLVSADDPVSVRFRSESGGLG
ncbi:MAG: hypothetical protein ACRDT0_20025 [Pseudonocardiaceae bacterium]